MPWSSVSFRMKHWRGATIQQARKAAEIANAILEGGGEEGVAIATAIKRVKAMK